MKRSKLTKLLIALASMVCIKVSAYDITSNGIFYNINWNDETLTCEVAQSSYSGEIVIPETIDYNGRPIKIIAIGDNAFKDCQGLFSITLPNTLETIGENAFSGCINLKEISFPQSLVLVKAGAFSGCVFERVTCESITAWSRINFENASASPFHNSETIASPLHQPTEFYIGNHLCTEELSIPEGVETIGHNAFSNIKTIKSVILPSTLVTISDGAFFRCESLKSINIPPSVTTIGSSAFQTCKQLSNVVIPQSVTSIGSSAFAYCKQLSNIVIPPSVTTIGSYAFYDCQLDTIKIDNFNESTSLNSLKCKEDVFDCKVLYARRNFYYPWPMYYRGSNPDLNHIGNVSEVKIGEEMTYIDEGGFYNVESLQSVIIEDCEKEIKAYSRVNTSEEGGFTCWPTFSGTQIRKVYLGRNLKLESPPYSANTSPISPFRDCSLIESITIGDNVTNINNVFPLNKNTNLSYLEIGKGLHGIPDLTNNINLSTIIVHNETPPIAEGFSTRTFLNCKLYVPKESKELYQNAKEWKNFFYIYDIDDLNTETKNIKKEDRSQIKAYYTIEGKKVMKPQKGLNIIRMGDGTTRKVVVK